MAKKNNPPNPDINDVRAVSSAQDYTGLVSGNKGNLTLDDPYGLPEHGLPEQKQKQKKNNK